MKRSKKEIHRSYFDKDFISSLDARPIRILSEYLHPSKAFQENNIENTIVFFGSARGKKLSILKNQKEASRSQDKYLANNYKEASQLAYRLTQWSKKISNDGQKYVICSGGGPGIMEATNRGAYLARGKSIGLGITLPFEQTSNEYISENLSFQFHYFFMRKYWFMYYAKSIVFFPGGFGTCDELFEILTLIQTKKIKNPLPLILQNKDFWKRLINFDQLIECGMIDETALDCIYFSESVSESFNQITKALEG